MSRQPKQVHIYLYRKGQKGYEFAIFQRRENPLWWQGICGGLEGDESLEEGARRELAEEAGVMGEIVLYPLECVSYLPVSIFSVKIQKIWGKSVVVVPLYFFAMPFEGKIILSEEHTKFKWLDYESAQKLVYFNDQKTALFELHEKLNRGLI